jgi:hypothetical protein
MQDEQDDLDRDIRANVQCLREEDIGAWRRHFFQEREQLQRSIQDSISQGANNEAKLTKGFVNGHYSPDSPGMEPSGFLPRLLETLHHSRRLQAARVLRNYQHLIDPACEYRLPNDQTKRSLAMSLNKTPSSATKASFSPAVKILVAAVILGFVVLHTVGDHVLRGPVPAANADMAGSNKYGD